MSDMTPKQAVYTDIANRCDALVSSLLAGSEQAAPDSVLTEDVLDQVAYDELSRADAAELAAEEPPRLHLLATHAIEVIENMRSQRDAITSRRSHRELLAGALASAYARSATIREKLKT